jgi:hypothetical protein
MDKNFSYSFDGDLIEYKCMEKDLVVNIRNKIVKIVL